MENDTIEEEDLEVKCKSTCGIHYHVVKQYNRLKQSIQNLFKKLMMCF